MTYDGAAINAHWRNAWPADASNPQDHDHEFSPVLQAPVANLLGDAWELECGSPGGDYVIWLYTVDGIEIKDGVSHIGVSPMVTDTGVNWYICSYDSTLYANPLEIDADGPTVDASPEDVVAWVKGFFDQHGYTFPEV